MTSAALKRTRIGLVALALASMVGCTLRTKPAVDTANAALANGPDGRGVAKSFFVNPDGTAKTFLCGWAPETELGFTEMSEMQNVPIATHCNVQFEITQDNLIGKLINPSFPDDPSHWLPVVMIPILKHYYYERKKDDMGRDTNEWIEDDQRSDYSARPYMKLDLSHIKVVKEDWQMLGPGTDIIGVEDIEWDLKNNYLGFTVLAKNDGVSDWEGLDAQGRYRVNFLKFDSNPNFKKTIYNEDDSKLFNVIQVVGQKVNGIYPVFTAAHWDVTRQHQVYLTNFPPEYIPVAEDVLNNWNKTLQNIGAVKPGFNVFVANTTPVKHAFDLRHTNINWISDPRVSASLGGVVGISMTNVDVRTGEILWSGVNVYAGQLKQYISSTIQPYTPTDGFVRNNNVASFLFNMNATASGISGITPPLSLTMPGGLSSFATAAVSSDFRDSKSEQMYELYNQQRTNDLNQKKDQIAKNTALTAEARQEALQQLATSPEAKTLSKDLVEKILAAAQSVSANKLQETQKYFANRSYRDLLTNLIMKTPYKYEQQAIQDRVNARQPVSVDFVTKTKDRFTKGAVYDLDYKLSDFGQGLSAAVNFAVNQQHRPFDLVVKSVFKEIMAHEFGHSLGLGHNFESNLLPARGTVPPQIYDALAKRATKDVGFTNSTSLMGYPDSMSELSTTYDQWVPGPQDKLVLRYLYNQTYSTYRPGDSHFTFFHIPPDGEIPAANPDNPAYKTSYFPQCNDIDASFGTSPFCNRFNRGTTATEIANTYLERINDNLIKDLNAIVSARGGNPDLAQMYLWEKSLTDIGRLRLFYDYMRRTYKNQIDQIREDEDALFAFSSSCQEPTDQIQNPTLKDLFTRYPDFKELCAVNAKIVKEYTMLAGLKASDYTTKDFNDSVVPGPMDTGDAELNYGRVFGSWKQMTSMPLKISSLYALTTPDPWVVDEALEPVENYDYEGGHYAYSSLYPVEYTQAIASAVGKNLFFATQNDSDTSTIGSTILSLSYLNALANQNNDTGLFPSEYIDKIRRQTNFQVSYVAILVSGQAKEGAPFYVDHFNGMIYDVNTGKTESLKSVYILPNGQVIADGENMFLLPVTPLQVYDDKSAYVIAYKVEYYKAYGDQLYVPGTTNTLDTLHNQLISNCLDGKDGAPGLSKYFAPKQFPGFYMPPDVATDPDDLTKFKQSVEQNFENYYKATGAKAETCQETLRGLGMLISTAAIINGYWIPEAGNYINQ